MPLNYPNKKLLLPYAVIGLTLCAIIFSIISISTTNWVHSLRLRAGLWKICHLQPLTCFHSVTHSPAGLSLTGLILISIGLISTIVFDIFKWQISSVKYIRLVTVFSLGLGSFFLVMSYTLFSRITAQFSYSYYFMIVGHIFAMYASIVAGYIQGQQTAIVRTSMTARTRLAMCKP